MVVMLSAAFASIHASQACIVRHDCVEVKVHATAVSRPAYSTHEPHQAANAAACLAGLPPGAACVVRCPALIMHYQLYD